MPREERECDFIRFSETGECEAVQVCWELTDDNRKREINGLVSALKHFNLKRGTLISHAQSDIALYDGCEIAIIPAYEYVTSTAT